MRRFSAQQRLKMLDPIIGPRYSTSKAVSQSSTALVECRRPARASLLYRLPFEVNVARLMALLIDPARCWDPLAIIHAFNARVGARRAGRHASIASHFAPMASGASQAETPSVGFPLPPGSFRRSGAFHPLCHQSSMSLASIVRNGLIDSGVRTGLALLCSMDYL